MTQAGGPPVQTSTIAIPRWFICFLSFVATTMVIIAVAAVPWAMSVGQDLAIVKERIGAYADTSEALDAHLQNPNPHAAQFQVQVHATKLDVLNRRVELLENKP